jgi:hypothetical protein
MITSGSGLWLGKLSAAADHRTLYRDLPFSSLS